MSASPRVRRLIDKLLRRAADPTAPHEAASARAEAERLMAEHGLSPADFEETVVETADTRTESYRRDLARIVAVSRRCKALSSKRDIAFKGRRSAVESAVMLYQSLETACSAQCEIGPRDPGRDLHRISFWQGFLDTIEERLRDDELQVPEPAPDSEPVVEDKPRVVYEHEPVRAAPVDEGPPLKTFVEEKQEAAQQFADFVPPWDRPNAFHHLQEQAYKGGRYLGQNVSIEPRSTEVAPNRALAGRQS